MPNSAADNDGVDITSRPFLADLATPAPSGGQAHLFAAATGANLHLVDDEEATHSIPSSASRPPAPADLPAEMAGTPQNRRERRVAGHRASTLGADGVDWTLVNKHVQELRTEEFETRTKASFDVALARGPETPAEEAAWVEITGIVERHIGIQITNEGDNANWPDEQKAKHIQAIFDTAFRYGRLQALLREPDIEDISIQGFDDVLVTKSSGSVERRPPIADNDNDLEELFASLASARNRVFARPNGSVDADLGGARFTANGRSTTTVPQATIRKHNLVDITLGTMVEKNTLSERAAQLLEAICRAHCSALVAGLPGAGKTSMLRALMSAVDPWLKIVTIETERELYLNKLSSRQGFGHVVDLEYVPNNVDSSAAAGYSLHAARVQALRMSAMMILYGELRGEEAPHAMAVMQAGRGSMSTIHAKNSDDAIHRFANMLMEQAKLVSDVQPLQQIMRSVDVVIQMELIEASPGQDRRRVVTQISEIVEHAESRLPFAVDLMRWDEETESHVMHEKPTAELMKRLVRAGLPEDFFVEDAS